MNEIKLIPMTRSLCHEFFEHYENDPNLYMDMNEFKPYIYSKEKADAYFDKQQRRDRVQEEYCKINGIRLIRVRHSLNYIKTLWKLNKQL